MTPDYFATLTATSESGTLEFKTTTGTRHEAAMTICAFWYQRGGRFPEVGGLTIR